MAGKRSDVMVGRQGGRPAGYTRPLSGWLRDGVDGLLPPEFEGRERGVRARLLVVLLSLGLLCVMAAVVGGAATGVVARELLVAAVACISGGALAVAIRAADRLLVALLGLVAAGFAAGALLGWPLVPLASGVAVAAGVLGFHLRVVARPALEAVPDLVRTVMQDERVPFVLLLDAGGQVLRVLRQDDSFGLRLAAGACLADCVHLRDRIGVLAAFSSLRSGGLSAELHLRAMATDDARHVPLKLVSVHDETGIRQIVGLGEAADGGTARQADMPDGLPGKLGHQPSHDHSGKASLLTAIGHELSIAGQGRSLPADLLAGALCHLSQTEAGTRVPEPARHLLLPLLDEALAAIRPEAARQGLRLCVDIAPGTEGIADADTLRLLLGTVIASAVQTASQGDITIRAQADSAGLNVTVTDGGDGLAPGPAGEPVPGCALLIARGLCNTLHGRLDICSRAGIGTIVDFFIPADCHARIAARPTKPRENIVSLTNVRKKAQEPTAGNPQAPGRRSA